MLDIEVSPAIIQIVTKLLETGIIVGSYVGFLFTETLIGAQRWTKRLRTIVGILGLLLIIIILLPNDSSAIAANNSPAGVAVAVFAALCAISSIMLLWQRRAH